LKDILDSLYHYIGSDYDIAGNKDSGFKPKDVCFNQQPDCKNDCGYDNFYKFLVHVELLSPP